MKELLERYGKRQSDLTRAFKNYRKPMSRTFAHYLWHGIKPPSLNAVMAIHQAFEEIPEKEIFEVLESTRKPPTP